MDDDAGGLHLRAELRGHTEDVSVVMCVCVCVCVCVCWCAVGGSGRGGRALLSSQNTAMPPSDRCLPPNTQVRALAVLPDGTLATGSRDKTIKLWKVDAGGAFAEAATLVSVCVWGVGWREGNDSRRCHQPPFLPNTQIGHTDYVTCLAVTPAGGLASGSRDTTAILWDVAAAEPATRATGAHKHALAGVAVTPGGLLLTAALDSRLVAWTVGSGGAPPSTAARAWPHPGPVQCVTPLPGGSHAATGCADGGLRLVRVDDVVASTSDGLEEGRVAASVAAHDDTLRGLTLLPAASDGAPAVPRLVTASHDATAKVWALPEGALAAAGGGGSSSAATLAPPTLVATLAGHTALVYAAAASADGIHVATASEDGSARVWAVGASAGAACVATLRHPGCVWAAAFLPDGDLVTACSDGVARVWTAVEARAGPPEAAAALAAQVAARGEAAAAAATTGGAPALPPGIKPVDASVLQAPGPPGKTVVVAGAGGGASVWEAGADGSWAHVGEVVSGPDAGGGGAPTTGGWHAGQAWDYLFDVDAAEGAPPLKLAYNRGENPYVAADRFLEENGLPQSYRETIVNHIIQHAGPAAAAAAAAAVVNVDPLTGGGAYVPPPLGGGGGGAASATAAAAADPFTGAGAYVPPPAAGGGGGAAPVGPGGFAVTGGGADPFTGTARATAATPPLPTYAIFDASPRAAAVADKAASLAAAAGVPVDRSDLAVLAAAAAERTPLPPLAAALLTTALATWPPSALFPVLDMARLVALTPDGAASLAAGAGDAAADAGGGLGRALAAVAAATPPSPPALATACRAIANAARHPPLRAWAGGRLVALAGVARAAAASGAPAAVSAAAAAVLNLGLLAGDAPPSTAASAAPALAAAAAAVAGVGDDEAATRAFSGVRAALRNGGAGAAPAVRAALGDALAVAAQNAAAVALVVELG